jgi:hypothetical protein
VSPALSILFAGAILLLVPWGRALMALTPLSIRLRGLPSVEPRPGRVAETVGALRQLGFSLLGVQEERRGYGLGGGNRSHALVDEGEETYFNVSVKARGTRLPFSYCLSTFADGTLVLTGLYNRRELRGSRVFALGIPGEDISGAIDAHRLAIRRWSVEHGKPQAPATLEARIRAARLYYSYPNWSELRSAHYGDVVMAFTGVFFIVRALWRATR